MWEELAGVTGADLSVPLYNINVSIDNLWSNLLIIVCPGWSAIAVR